MHEHTIPETLIEQIRSGKAALVVGAGIGVPSWKQLLERMTKALETRGRDGDDVATKDLEKLLSKGNLVRAVGFLARALGEEVCDRIVEEMWTAPAETPALPKALASLPFRHVWTTFPGDVLEHALETQSPADWPTARVVTYQELGELSPRRRTLVKMLGNFDTYVVTPASVRRALSRAVDLRDYARKLYVEGSLVFVGFRYGDPDLSALLDRVFGMFEPPRGTHYFLGAGVGPVTVDELMADHHIEVVNLAGRGGDEVAERSVIEWLDVLKASCETANVTLAQTRPDADDTEGWIALLGESGDEGAEARDALDLIERKARDGKDWESVIEVLLGKIEHAGDGPDRAQLLRGMASVYETGLGDLQRAFESVMTACQVDPADDEAAAMAERLAAATGGWADLVNEASTIAQDAGNTKTAATWWARLGNWYTTRLDRIDYALPSLRRALEIDSTNSTAYKALAEAHRKQQKWADLADTLRAHAEIETDAKNKVDLLLGLGDLLESQLAQSAKAIEAYQAAADADESSDDALAALERLYRRDERWPNLAKVLERRAEIAEEGGDKGRAAALRRELGTMRAEKLGDLEGAIARYEATVSQNGGDVEALKALVDLYDKTGRTDDYLRSMERLAGVAPEGEKLATLRKLAAELEDREPERAISAYEKLLAADMNADDAYRGLERVLEQKGDWHQLVNTYSRHVSAARSPAQRVELYLAAAKIYETKLDDSIKAIEAMLNVLAIEESDKTALAVLPRLYNKTEQFDRAVDVLVRHAALEGDSATAPQLYAEAGRLALEQMGDAEVAARHFDKALSLDAESFGALRGLAKVNEERGNAGQAVELLLRAEATSGNRLERVELLVNAAMLAEVHLKDAAQALDLNERVLKLDPDHVGAGTKVADQLIAAKRWDDALPTLEMLARKSEGLDKAQVSQREAMLGRAYEQLHRTEKAEQHYRRAVEANPTNLDASIGLAAVLMLEAKAHEGNESAVETWKEIDRRYREILARHGTSLNDTQVSEIWYRLGVVARAQGEDKKAEMNFRRALEKDSLHEPTLDAMIELGGQRGEWKMVADAKRAKIDAVHGASNEEEARRAKLFEEIGDIYHERIKDVNSAVDAYQEGVKLAPGSRILLHKLLESYTEQKSWKKAIDALDHLSSQETTEDRRARFHYTAAVIARDELKDVDLAVDRFNAALDDAPFTPKAFDAIDALLAEKGDWKNLARAYRRQLKRMGEDASPDRMLELWTRLGDICLEHLNDTEAATEAYQVACELAPDDVARHEQLADLYLDAGEARRPEAIAELQFLLGHAPDRAELYKALASLYRAEHDLDKAFCVAQALVFLGAASDEERMLYERLRPSQFTPAPRRLTEELWQKSIIHPKEDRHVGAIFSSTLGAVAAGTAQPVSAFGLTPETRTDLDRDQRIVSRIVKYVSGVLAIDPAPMVWLQEQGDGLRVANTVGLGAERQRLVPSLLVGAPQITKTDERELAFEVGKRIAYLRPERFVTLAVGTLPKLESAFAASVLASGARVKTNDGSSFAEMATDDTKKLAGQLKAQVPGPLLEQVGELSAKLSGRVGNGLISSWRTATDLTANRVGFIVANDLEAAAKAIATEGAAMSNLSVKDRLRDLLAYSVSEQYFTVRRHLGLHVRSEASA
ncbi:MAG TPA: tetratricopeptide repeat protein [Kofleriaceae bacterium]|jgi:tetratricopeptide (TPR) repeat protein